MMDTPKGNPEFSKAVNVIEGYKDKRSVLVAVTASTDLATALGGALTTSDVGVTIISDGNLHYEVDGTDATTSNAKLPTVYTVQGGKTNLDLVRLYSASSQDVGLIVFGV